LIEIASSKSLASSQSIVKVNNFLKSFLLHISLESIFFILFLDSKIESLNLVEKPASEINHSTAIFLSPFFHNTSLTNQEGFFHK